jgi:hypothetical protein
MENSSTSTNTAKQSSSYKMAISFAEFTITECSKKGPEIVMVKDSDHLNLHGKPICLNKADSSDSSLPLSSFKEV